MLDLAEPLSSWYAQGRAFAVATVVAVQGSAPRQPGAAMAVDADGTVLGSVSGGCVESAVFELCQEALESGRCFAERFGYSDQDAFAVGLTCGGQIDVFVQPVLPGRRPELGQALAGAASPDGVALARVVAGPDSLLGEAVMIRADGTWTAGVSDPALAATLRSGAQAFLANGSTGTLEVGAWREGPCEPVTLLVEASTPPPRLLVFGATDLAAAVVRVGAYLGYRVTVCDARPVFATRARFPEAAEVVVDWPHRYLDTQELDPRTAVCVLTHDRKFELPLLQRALRLPLAFVGALGSRRSHEERLALLREAGVTDAELGRLHSPIGLDLGGRTPEETALSIAAEIVAHRHGASGLPLAGTDGPIHRVGRSTTAVRPAASERVPSTA
ncbi:XdhC family protein [Actinacidiphila acididurans]|uniref:XdhC family protein n=1 Tax=Actinacidiphila acididurans TaxID=2784346 RepID=A0ABS2TXV3_9ACTN|nr:XdhC/CoxI family protein [Actinacidiphila acididurans]MBM9507912.1 XdhC family protein [Actinacidiphila acididurans]